VKVGGGWWRRLVADAAAAVGGGGWWWTRTPPENANADAKLFRRLSPSKGSARPAFRSRSGRRFAASVGLLTAHFNDPCRENASSAASGSRFFSRIAAESQNENPILKTRLARRFSSQIENRNLISRIPKFFFVSD
jgi:hypothetical protein